MVKVTRRTAAPPSRSDRSVGFARWRPHLSPNAISTGADGAHGPTCKGKEQGGAREGGGVEDKGRLMAEGEGVDIARPDL